MRHTPDSSWAAVGKVIAAVLAIGAVTAACKFVKVNQTTTGFAFLITVLFIASGWGLTEAIVASIAGMLCYNFFFLPPVGTFTIADPQNWIALAAFLVTAIVASQLSASVKRQAHNAIRRQLELERLYGLGRAILLDSGELRLPARLARHVADAFELRGIVFYEASSEQVYMAGPEDLTLPGEILHKILAGQIETAKPGPDLHFAVVRLGTKPAGVLGIHGVISST
ncbi:MAG TPA: DUF4118 domain-containing protein, partial [Bryobacteraceae bacterium]